MQTPSTTTVIIQTLEPVKKKLGSEDIFKYANIAVNFMLLFCVKGFLQYRAHCESKSYYVFAVDSLIWVGAGFFFFFVTLSFIQITKYSYFHFMKNRIYQSINHQYQGEQRAMKTQYVLKLSYNACFYTFTTIVAYALFRRQYWFPSIIGGSGECSKIYQDYPNWPKEKRTELQIYFLFQLGVHAFSVFEMVVIKRKTQKKFHEYLLHHFVATSLILFSLMSNQIVPGVMILIVHDMSDIVAAVCRGFLETRYITKYNTAILYMSLVISWIFCRVWVFPSCLLSNVYVNAPLSTDEWYMIDFEYKYLLSMAFVLYVMNLYWTFYLLKAGVNAVGKKKITNAHEKASN